MGMQCVGMGVSVAALQTAWSRTSIFTQSCDVSISCVNMVFVFCSSTMGEEM